ALAAAAEHPPELLLHLRAERDGTLLLVDEAELRGRVERDEGHVDRVAHRVAAGVDERRRAGERPEADVAVDRQLERRPGFLPVDGVPRDMVLEGGLERIAPEG